MPARSFPSFEVFHRFVPSLVKRISKDPSLAARAMVNPLLALEEVGVELPPEVAREVVRRVRFTGERRQRVEALERRLVEALGGPCDPESQHDLERVLYKQLKLECPEGPLSLELPRKPSPPWLAKAAPPAAGKAKRRLPRVEMPPDPLGRWRGKHPVVDLLLEIRELLAAAPRFASRAEYEALKARPHALPIAGVTLHLPEHTEDPHA